MTTFQDIVPVKIESNQPVQQVGIPVQPSKSKIALRLKRDDLDITFYNGCDKYLLYAVLKELNIYDR